MGKDQSMGWVRKAAAFGGVSGIFKYITFTYILPYGLPIMTGVVGWAQDVPWAHLIALVVFVSSMTFHGLVQWDELKTRKDMGNKIGFSRVRFGKEISGKGITVGFEISNLADFPIKFQVTKLSVKIGDKVPIEEHRISSIVTIPPRGRGWHDSHAIKIDSPPKPGTLEGSFYFSFRYGRFNSLDHEFAQKKKIVVAFDNSGTLIMGNFTDETEED